MGPPAKPQGFDVSAEEFATLFRTLSTWGRWGDTDERGALHYLCAEHVAAAARLIRDGITISLSWPLNTVADVHNPHPADHHMTAYAGADTIPGSPQFEKDYIGVDYHSETHTHIDALCHVAHNGMLYNGTPIDVVDRLNRDCFRLALEIGDDADKREWAMTMLLAARAIERIGDNAVDIGEQVAFVVTGLFREFEDASHPSA